MTAVEVAWSLPKVGYCRRALIKAPAASAGLNGLTFAHNVHVDRSIFVLATAIAE